MDAEPTPSLLRRLDYVPPWAGVVVGLALGAVAGAAVLSVHPIAGAVAFVALVGLAAALAWSGEPIAVIEEPVEVESLEVEQEIVEPEPAEAALAIGPKMVRIPAGVFFMGSPDDEEEHLDREGPVHEVRVSRFECMRCPVTRELYLELVGEDPGWPEGSADRRPVNKVSWFDVVKFCNLLSERSGLELCYRIEEKEVAWIRAAAGYRLPTEAEWEYACRAGTRTRWSFGDEETRLGEHAWFSGNSESEPQPVGGKQPNAWGLFDMHGNVFEWCWDWYGEYGDEPQDDPAGSPSSSGRVLRGGSFAFSPRDLRSAYRVRDRPGGSGRYIGFRCVRGPRLQP